MENEKRWYEKLLIWLEIIVAIFAILGISVFGGISILGENSIWGSEPAIENNAEIEDDTKKDNTGEKITQSDSDEEKTTIESVNDNEDNSISEVQKGDNIDLNETPKVDIEIQEGISEFEGENFVTEPMDKTPSEETIEETKTPRGKADELYNRAVEESENGNYEVAVNYYEQAIEYYDEDPAIYYNLGKKYEDNIGDYEKACDNYIEAAKLGDEQAYSDCKRVIMLNLKGEKNEKAYEYYQKLLEIKEEGEVYKELAVLADSIYGNLNEAIYYIDKALELEPDSYGYKAIKESFVKK